MKTQFHLKQEVLQIWDELYSPSKSFFMILDIELWMKSV